MKKGLEMTKRNHKNKRYLRDGNDVGGSTIKIKIMTTFQ